MNKEYYSRLQSLLKVSRVMDKSLIRLGKDNDGGYVMVDNFNSPGIAYSFGICDDVSWDYDMTKHGYDVFMYDMTIDSLPFDSQRFHFFKQGISGTEDQKASLDTLEHFVKRNGHWDNANMILKMDVEGAEWSFLSTVSAELLSKFDQMVFEFHNLTGEKSNEQVETVISCLKKLQHGHTVVHVHGNNCGSFITLDDGEVFPQTLEVTYVKTDSYNLEYDENICLPIALDQPNGFGQEIMLGFWNRRR